MATIKSRSSQRHPNDNYRSGWDNIFGKSEADGDVTAYPVLEPPDCAPCAREVLRVDGPCPEHSSPTPRQEYVAVRSARLDEIGALTCEVCGSRNEKVEKTLCPYAQDVEGRDIEAILCPGCYESRVMDI